MGFALGVASNANLKGVHPDLVKVVQLAITYTDVDFKVNEGVREIVRQRVLVAKGASQTMDSRHLTGHAVDLVAIVSGSPRWDWPLYYKIAKAVQRAANELKVSLVWGGCWDKPLTGGGDSEAMLKDYVLRRRAAGKKVFTDGPHFELSRKEYP